MLISILAYVKGLLKPNRKVDHLKGRDMNYLKEEVNYAQKEANYAQQLLPNGATC